MDDTLYDEFGNYIGPDVDDSDEDVDQGEFEDNLSLGDADATDALVPAGDVMDVDDDAHEDRIVLHEDKQYYPEAEEVYGEGVRNIVLEEDAQALEEPIIKPIKKKKFTSMTGDIPELRYSASFMTSLMEIPSLVRNVAVLGQLHHGKTSLVDSMVRSTHEKAWAPGKIVRYTDTRKDEQERELSIKVCPVSMVLEGLSGKSHLVNILDCPGHVNFHDECSTALRAADGALIVVDAIEGVMLSTTRLIRRAVAEGVKLTLCINKLDRLILELKFPPADAYHKLRDIIDEVNSVVRDCWSGGGRAGAPRLSPSKGNVCFSSALHGWSFSLESFAEHYCTKMGKRGHGVSPTALASRLWGDWYMDGDKGAFTKTKPKGHKGDRTFIEFILAPLYKMYSACVGEEPPTIIRIFKQEKVVLTVDEAARDPRELLCIAIGRFFGPPRGLATMLAKHVPAANAPAATARKLDRHYGNGGVSRDDGAASARLTAMRRCDASSSGPLTMHVVKMLSSPEGDSFACLARVYAGRVSVGQQVQVLGERFTPSNDEDAAPAVVTGLSIPCGRFAIDVSTALAGNIVLIEGIDASIRKTATVVDSFEDAAVFHALTFDSEAVVKLAVEPVVPAELPRMLEALRCVSKSYPLCHTRVEESGEHILLATGELAMDCIMHDVRHLHAEIEVKVCDPSASFCETVVDMSAMKCYASTPNQLNKLTMIAEPLDDGLGLDIEGGRVPGAAVSGQWERKPISSFLQENYGWDLMSASRVWAFGPEHSSPNILLDDTLPGEVDRGLLSAVRNSVVQGFRWGCREGPLCDETVRNVKVKILDANIAASAVQRGAGQIIPAARRATYSSMLMATPRLMEPVYAMQVQAPADCVDAVQRVLTKRRGQIVSDAPKAGAPFYVVKAYVPVMDSFGFETDLRAYTQGQAMCQQVFDHWSIVPGDPLDRDIVLHPLEPSPEIALAKDFVIKTRRRKGLPDAISLAKYIDDSELLAAAQVDKGASSLFQ